MNNNLKKMIIVIICLIVIALSLKTIFNKDKKVDLNRKVDATKYKMNLELDTKDERLYEDVTIEIVNNTNKDINEIYLREMTSSIHEYNKENYDEGNEHKSSLVESVLYNGSDSNFKYDDDKSIIIVPLENKLKVGEKASINIKMYTDIPDRQDRFGLIKKDLGKLYTLSFFYPYLADNINGEWILDPYFDDGESRSYDLKDFEVEVKVDKKYAVVGTGSEETKDGVTIINAKNVRDFAIVVSDYIKKDTFKVSDITVNNYYFEGENSKEYRELTKLVATDSINQYTDNIGKYPYDSLDILPCVFGFSFGGMEYPMLVMTNATSFYEGKLRDPWSLYEGLAHEIGHEWFYATVGNREYAEGWIDEAFTTYITSNIFGLYEGDAYKYTKEIDNLFPSIEETKKTLDTLLKDGREDYKNVFVNINPSDYKEDETYGEGEYHAGHVFLLELEKEFGKEKFNKFLKDYYKRYYLGVATTKDVLDLIREYDNSKKVNEIIKFYVKEK